jgi:hypothetical protein
LAELAQRLGADWRHGDNVMTWIRRHEATSAELSRLVRDGWAWADVGLALALAGIKYQTGSAIPGDLLRRKAGKARADERKRQASEALRCPSVAPAVEPVVPPVQQQASPRPSPVPIGLPPAETNFPIMDEEPEFKPVTLIRYGVRNPPETLPPPKREPGPAPSPAIDVDAVLARFTGRK